jgi:hypothetical protein
VTRRTYGILASVIGSAVGAWWYVRRRQAGSLNGRNGGNRDRGRVIFDNTPTAVETPAI